MSEPRTNAPIQGPTVFGHPAGLFTLFFAEMWERFSYYGMRALLVFYMIKGFLGYNDNQAYAIYGSYTSLVYATPFIGGMLADRLLGQRRAIVLGGLLMAAGHLLMTVEHTTAFFYALALLILGNGFFKPNISTIVGTLYPEGNPRRDGGFTIFYMGINLGAAMSPVLCGYVGETYGWHYGFGLATIGMLVGVAVFVAPTRLTQLLILGGSIVASVGMLCLWDTALQLAVRIVLAITLISAGIIASIALNRGGIPVEAGRPPNPEALMRKKWGLSTEARIYLGVAVALPIIALLVQRDVLAGWILFILGGTAFLWLVVEAFKCEKVARERMFVVLILCFFSMLFWAFFEQAGSSMNNFADRNVDRVFEERTLTQDDVGTTIPNLKLTQEQLGRTHGEQTFTLSTVEKLRKDQQDTVSWQVDADDVGMGIGGAEIPASEFQATNAIFIFVFGLVFTALWSFLASRRLEPSTPAKFALGILQLGLGFAALWYGSQHADSRGVVGLSWLILCYLLHTTGELCLSPVGLSAMTKLSPARLVSTVMGAWFLATAFSQYLAAIISKFTSVTHEGEGGNLIPVPAETVHVYGDVFGHIAITAIISALICFALTPLLKKWMHTDVS